MITNALFRQPVPLNVNTHAEWRMNPQRPAWTAAAALNAVFLASVEFADASSEFPIVFVPVGQGPDGQRQIAPIAVMGTQDKENLYIQGDQWRGRYVPALLQAYPFAMTRVSEQQVVLMTDAAWEGWSQTEGTALFTAPGQASEHLEALRAQLEKLEVEVQRTRLLGELLVRHGLLKDMRFEAVTPKGQKLVIDGFLAVDEEKLAQLPDEAVVELHRNGALGLIHAHQISLRQMRKLIEWRVQASESH